MAKGRRYRNRVKKQTGGELIKPKGLIQQGTGRTDPSSAEGLPVDDVSAILGKGEYVLNANAVNKVGTQFLDELNNVGLSSGNKIKPGTLPSPSRYQKGGQVNGRKQMARKKLKRGGPVRRKPIRRQAGGGTCPTGQHWMPASNGKPGYCMKDSMMKGNGSGGDSTVEGRTLVPSLPWESQDMYDVWSGGNQGGKVSEATMTGYQKGGKIGKRKPIRRQMGGHTNQCPPGQTYQNGNCTSSGGGYQRGGKVRKRKPIRRQSGGYVFAGTTTSYTGRVINVGGQPYTTKGGGIEGSRKRLELQKGGTVKKPVRRVTPIKKQVGGRVRRVKRQRGGVVNRIRRKR